MAIKRIKQGAGLFTDVAALDAPEGAMRVADNVMCHRPGILEPRPGIGDTTGVAARDEERRPIRLYAYDGEVFAQSKDGLNYFFERVSVDTEIDDLCDPPDPTIVGTSNAAEARGNLYVCTSSGLKKISDKTDTAMEFAGAHTHFLPIVTTTTNAGGSATRCAIKTSSVVAYRYCWVTEDANGYERRSYPSARWLVSGTQTNVIFDRVYLPRGIGAGARIEIYRSESVSSGSTPPEEIYLAVTYTVSSADVSAGYITERSIVDDCVDANLGAALYTNLSQGGILGANEVPPVANCVAEWGGVMWYGNTTSRPTLPMQVLAAYGGSDPAFDDVSFERVGWGERFLTCSWSASSTTLTAASSTSGGKDRIFAGGIRPSTYVSVSPDELTITGTWLTSFTKITAIATVVTIVNASLSDGHTFEILGETFTWRTSASLAMDVQIGASSALSAAALKAKLDAFVFDEQIDISAAISTATLTITANDSMGVSVIATQLSHLVSATVTIDKPTLALGTNKLVTFHDWCTINGVEFYAAGLQGGAIAHISGGGLLDTHLDDRYLKSTASIEDCALGFMYGVAGYSIVEDDTFGVLTYADQEQRASMGGPPGGEFTLMREFVNQGALTFRCTVRPRAFRPNAAETLTSESTRARNRLYWSKMQEPEAVPLLNYTDIGRSDRNILALVPLDNALLIFKEDGIYRVTGSGPSNWVVDELDTDKRLLAPSATTVLDNICYALTDRGVFQVSETGVAPTPISAPVGDMDRRAQALLPLGSTASKRTFWMESHPRLGLVILALGTNAESAHARWAVWHRATGAWTNWYTDDSDDTGRAWHCATYDPASGRLAVGGGLGDWSVALERTSSPLHCDRVIGPIPQGDFGPGEYQVLIVDQADLDVTPQAGDSWLTDNVTYPILDVSEDSGSWLLTLDSPHFNEVPETGTWLESYPIQCLWQAQHLAGLDQRWQELHLALNGPAGSPGTPLNIHMSVGGGSTLSDSGVSTVPLNVTGTALFGASLRVGLPRAVVRTPQLFPCLLTRCAGFGFDLTHLYLHHTTTGRRVARGGAV